MPFFEAAVSLELLDGASCALLAAAAACRAKNLSANLFGAVILGSLCALLAPCLRETLLRGGAIGVLRALPDDAFIGALAGIAACLLLKKKQWAIFFWLDCAGAGLTAALYALLGVPDLGIVGAIALGAACALGPGLLRDVALGDTAMFVDKNWYAAAIFTGCVTAIIMDAALFVGLSAESHLQWAIILGAAATCILRRWKTYRPD